YDASYRSFKCDNSIKIRYAYISLYCGNLNKCKEILSIIPSNHLQEELKISYKITEALYTWKNGNIEKSIEICKILNETYKHTLVYETLGYLLLISKKYKEALIYNRKAYEYDNSNNIIIDNLAQSYYYLGYYEKAQELYKSLLYSKNKNLSFSEPYYYYGLILNKLGDKDGCIRYLKEALAKKEAFLSDLSHKKINEVLSSLI
ncbi:tetratricopeptide repeat protein, partial [Clostridium sp. D53t1_180928_C8]|uniref:tetratricopeptide repeat protein n=1 Tax=Clostridium sp. D53t1_180928_C8 TaxID=2787101 RepID=UPI0018AC5C1A